tara:strand:+ start:1278 stop:1859 length:582 start_codon:yes stop_codon:yes gene_type:complete
VKKKIIYKFLQYRHLYFIFTFFDYIKEEKFVVVKLNLNFPNVPMGSDFDIYLYAIHNFENHLNNFLKNKKNYSIRKILINSSCIQFDLSYKSKFIYKFDLYDVNHKSDIFNDKLISDAVDSKKEKKFYFLKKFTLNVPEFTYNHLIRALEYYKNPHKIHHLNELRKLNSFQSQLLDLEIKKYSQLNLGKIVNI